MKKISQILFLIIMACCIISVVSACSSRTYTLTLQDTNGYVIENLNNQYKAGERVIVKTDESKDVDLVAYLDDFCLGHAEKIYEQDEYFYGFSFGMPSHDVVLSFKVSDGVEKVGLNLAQDAQSEIITAYVNAHSNVIENGNRITLRCYGAFDGVYVLFVDGTGNAYFQSIFTESVAGIKFVYATSQMLTVYSDNTFYTLAEAYKKKIVSRKYLLEVQENFKITHISFYN